MLVQADEALLVTNGTIEQGGGSAAGKKTEPSDTCHEVTNEHLECLKFKRIQFQWHSNNLRQSTKDTTKEIPTYILPCIAILEEQGTLPLVRDAVTDAKVLT